jgi:hypothetical protein
VGQRIRGRGSFSHQQQQQQQQQAGSGVKGANGAVGAVTAPALATAQAQGAVRAEVDKKE